MPKYQKTLTTYMPNGTSTPISGAVVTLYYYPSQVWAASGLTDVNGEVTVNAPAEGAYSATALWPAGSIATAATTTNLTIDPWKTLNAASAYSGKVFVEDNTLTTSLNTLTSGIVSMVGKRSTEVQFQVDLTTSDTGKLYVLPATTTALAGAIRITNAPIELKDGGSWVLPMNSASDMYLAWILADANGAVTAGGALDVLRVMVLR